MLKNLRKKSIVAFSLMSVFLFSQSSFSRNSMKGEVGEDEAYIQTMDGSGSYIKAKIKIKQTGSYVVIAGFYKGDCWHKGTWTQTKYYSSKRISGDSGDVIDVEFNVSKPPMNNNQTVGVFKSIDNICTKG